MAKVRLTCLTRRSVVAGLSLTAPAAILAGSDPAYAQVKQTAPEKSLYERLGGVFAIAAVVDHFSDAVVKNPIVGQKAEIPSCENGTPRAWTGCPASNSCARYGSATFPEGPSHLRPRGPAPRRSALRRRTGSSGFHRQNSMRWRPNSDALWISSRSPSPRKPRF
jgi:hypothetical protein